MSALACYHQLRAPWVNTSRPHVTNRFSMSALAIYHQLMRAFVLVNNFMGVECPVWLFVVNLPA
jgi:hypothetical protein